MSSLPSPDLGGSASRAQNGEDLEDERDGYTQYDVSEFQPGEDTGSSHVDLTFSTDIPTNIGNMMAARTRIRDKQMHQQLKADLVEHV
uniref:Uncharacterized protein n=1 Tax=Brassica oleracea var. oleracea TaxID=109376 RepID=A0A0D3B795_BRAOL